MREQGELHYLFSDHLGSTSVTTDAAGVKEAEMRYKAYGEERWSSGTMPTSFQYTGQRNDAEIGLYFYQSRYYDASLARFAQADTIVPDPTSPMSLNRYMYVSGNPLKYRDPSGHYEFEDDPDVPYRPPKPPKKTRSLPRNKKFWITKEHGRIDTTHWGAGNPDILLQNVQAVIRNGGGEVRIEAGILGAGTYVGYYMISGELSVEDDTISVALGIYMDWSRRFESWENTIMFSIGGIGTSFANEDLPTHYLSFVAAAKNMTQQEVIGILGPVTGTNKPLPFSLSSKNFEFTPRIQNADGQWHNTSWPEELTITPLDNSPEIWDFHREVSSMNYLKAGKWLFNNKIRPRMPFLE